MRAFTYLFWMSYYFITGLPFLLLYCIVETWSRIIVHLPWRRNMRGRSFWECLYIAFWKQGWRYGVGHPVSKFFQSLNWWHVMEGALWSGGRKGGREWNPIRLVKHTRYPDNQVYRIQLQLGACWWASWGRGRGYIGGMTLILWHRRGTDRFGHNRPKCVRDWWCYRRLDNGILL